jgi:hypothetical protein
MAEAARDLGGHSDLLAELRQLRHRARANRQGYWFPLVLFGLLICASVPFYLQSVPPESGAVEFSGSGPALPFLGGYRLAPGDNYLGFYWLAVLLGALLVTQLWYWSHARRVGVATQARWYVIITAAITLLALLIPVLSQVPSLRPLATLMPGDLVMRGTFPFVIVAAGLLVLAWIERSLLLAVIAAVYSGAAVLASLYNVSNMITRLGWNLPLAYTALPNVLLPALVLILGAAAALAASRHQEHA